MKEAYVKFGTAKLLKEKGFDIPSDTSYEDCLWQMYDKDGKVHWGIYNGDWYFRITQQMACRWLRETQGLWIIPMPCEDGGYYFKIYKRYGKIWKDNIYDHTDYEDFDEPEDAIEAALEYCLTNLI